MMEEERMNRYEKMERLKHPVVSETLTSPVRGVVPKLDLQMHPGIDVAAYNAAALAFERSLSFASHYGRQTWSVGYVQAS